MMYRTPAFNILLCFVTIYVGITNSSGNTVGQKVEVVPTELLPEPTRTTTPAPPTTTVDPTTKAPNTTTVAPTTSPPTTPKPTQPTTPNTTTSHTTPSTPSPTPPSTSTPTPPPTTPTTAPTPAPGPTNATTTVPPAPSTTSAPLPPPSDRKFDAFSFLGGFALGLGLVAIGFLSWKFYLSRQENYYHTL